MINQKNSTGLDILRRAIRKLKDPAKAKILARSFKTSRGEYGESDKFLGLVVPACRQIAKRHVGTDWHNLETLIKSPWHEERLIALLILVEKFKKGDTTVRRKIFRFYLQHTSFINNWNLVDLSVPKIVGRWLSDKDWRKLKTLAKSRLLWEKRIAIVITFDFLKRDKAEPTEEISKLLLTDRHDLIHKAIGWMLREMGKNYSPEILLQFIKENYERLPRTTLRYAIERFPEAKRRKLLIGNFN